MPALVVVVARHCIPAVGNGVLLRRLQVASPGPASSPTPAPGSPLPAAAGDAGPLNALLEAQVCMSA